MGWLSTWQLSNKIRKLENKKRDLSDDTSAISTINSKIDAIDSDARSFLPSANSLIVSKLGAYKEPLQWNDYDLTQAAYYIQREINYLEREKTVEENRT